MRLSITLILLSCMSLAMAQSNTSDSKLEEEERKRLENQFKALKNFYINDQGLVVYQTQGNDARIVEETETANSNDTLTIYVDDFSNEQAVSPIRLSESVNSENPSATIQNQNTESYTPNYSTVNSSANVISINKKPIDPVLMNNRRMAEIQEPEAKEVSPVFTAETAKPDDIPVNTSRIIAIPPDTKTTNKPASIVDPAEIITGTGVFVETARNEEEETAEADADENIITPAKSSKKSIFEKEPSKYESMEAAAWATQDLLDKLKSEQSSPSSSGSLSSRLAKGAGNSSLRKSQSSIGGFGSRNLNRPMISEKTIEDEKKFEEAATPYTVEPVPTYYINGVEVEKSVVDKLRKGDILSRQVKSRNTQSGNPAGEVWIELK